MANASVELVCSWCGETFHHEKIFRNREDAKFYGAWAQDNISLCLKCYSERMKQDKLRKCEEKIGNRELAPLSGTEKQVAWTNEIPTQMVDLLVGKSQDVSDDMWEAINRFTSAEFWIDNRFKYGDVRHTIIDNLVRHHKFAHLSGDPSCVTVEEELGYLLTLVLVDKCSGDEYSGIVRGIRAVGLDHDFSVALINEIQNAKSVPFNRNDYERAINDVYGHYSTEDLVKMSRARCAI